MANFTQGRTGGRTGDLFIRVLTAPLAVLDGFMVRVQRLVGIQRMGVVFALPNLLIFGIFILLPMVLNFYYGFTGGNEILPERRPFVGTRNLETLLYCDDYRDAVSCEEQLFWRGATNTLRFVIVEVAAIVAISLLTALVLNRPIRARGFFRSVFFYPVLLSPVVIALIWKWILQSPHGVLNALIAGAGGERIQFLVSADWANLWVIVISVWAQMGFYTLILLAGLQAIPADLYEAASIDGAGGLQQIRRITLPLLGPTMLVVLVLSVIRAVQVFDLVWVLTGGGPGTATQFLVQYIYQTAFLDRRYGVAASASLLLAITLFIFTVVQLRLRRAGAVS